MVLNEQLKCYTRFLNQHKQTLRRIEDALGPSLSQTWEYDLNPVELKVNSNERKKTTLCLSSVFAIRTSSSIRFNSYRK